MGNARVLYHARAAGMAGTLNGKPLDVRAASALPHSGGVSNSAVTEPPKDQPFSFRSVTSSATGRFNPETNAHETDVVSSVEQFQFGEIISADLIHMEIHSTFTPDGLKQPSIVPTGSKIINLKIYGEPVQVESLVDTFTELSTLDKIREKHLTDKKFRGQIHEYCMVGQYDVLEKAGLDPYFPFCQSTPGDVLKENRYAATLPLFRVTGESKGKFLVVQNVILIEGFGRVQLGEFVITPFERHITGLSIDLETRGGADAGQSFDFGSSRSPDNLVLCAMGGGTGETNPP